MADNAQNAIPPKAVPPAQAGADAPTVRRQPVPAEGAPLAPSAAPRTVRLKPVQVPIPGAAPVAPSATPGGALAAEALKRMTSRIPLPSATGHITSAAGEGAAAVKRATVPLAADDGSDDGAKKVTSRIPMPSSTAAIPAVADAPKTIKIKPLTGPQSATQPVAALGESPQPQAAKSKTSRIPLEAAMGIPQTGDGGAPKTIKLKRPGDMSTVKVAVAGAGSGEADASAITQRKTIRVKRASAPVMTMSSGEGTAEGGATSAPAPVAFQPAPERGAGPFVAVAVLCILMTLALLVVFSSQIFGPNASLTQVSIWPGIDLPLPGTINAEG